MTKPKLFAAGGAHIDRRGRVAGPYIPGASNPGIMREEVGGGVFNALRNAARRGCAGALLSVRGGDMAGDAVANAIGEAGIADLSATFLDRATPSAISRPSEPVEMVSISTTSSLAPSRMIEPLPNARSIWESAASRAFVLSTELSSTSRNMF
jgi:hypothetical protein